MNNVKDNVWIYPVSMGYRKSWSEWESIREIVQNMMDTNTDYIISKKSDGLLLKDNGCGLKKKHLIIGVSDKPDGSRGEFGEGLKFALIILKRMGYGITLKSNNLSVLVDETLIEDERCLKLHIDETKNRVVSGTEVFIKGYTGKTYKNRFVKDNKRILFSSKYGDIIDEVKTRLYKKDIYVCDLKNARYSYNLVNVSVSEDRNIPNEYSLKENIGKIYGTVTMNNMDILVTFFESIDNQKYEENTDISSYYIDDENAWINAFKKVYGENAVLKTSEDWSREAKWRNAIPITLPRDIHEALMGLIETDKEFVQKQNEAERIIIDDKDLNGDEIETLNILRNLSPIIDKNTKIFVALQDTPACYSTSENTIFYNRPEMENLQSCLGHLVHELTHTYGCNDMTEEMVHQMGRVAGKLLFQFVDYFPKRREKSSDESIIFD